MSMPQAELCVASYRAERVSGHIVVFATGVHHASGCVVFFRREPELFPPRLSLWHLPPALPGIHTVTPFTASLAFQSTEEVEEITIIDAVGCHLLPVFDSPAATLTHTP